MNTIFNMRANMIRLSEEPGLVGQVLALAYILNHHLNERLTVETRFKRLSLVYEGYISRLTNRDYSPAELAEELGVSRQACSKIIKELLARGLIERRVNPRDARSNLITLSTEGHQLVAAGIGISRDIEQRFKGQLEDEDFDKFITSLRTLCRNLAPEFIYRRSTEKIWSEATVTQPLVALLPALSEICYQHMIDVLDEKGFKGLKPNFGQVLALIQPDGGRIQQIAAVVGVSKQAIAVIATDLEALGYITRETDPADQRQLVLKLSPLGVDLMAQSMTIVTHLTEEIRALLGDDDFTHLEKTLNTIFKHASEEIGQSKVLDLQLEKLAREVLDEHGKAGAQLLANKLLKIAGGIK